MQTKSVFKGILPFLPLLAVYVVFILAFSSDGLIYDEARHMLYAENLTQGFYTEASNPELRNGPGYPLIIFPFVLLKAPYIVLKLLNAVFLVAGIIFFYKTLISFMDQKRSILLSYLLGLYPALFKWLPLIHSEIVAFSLVCAFLYYFLKLHRANFNKISSSIIAACLLGLLTLTKVIFGYVIICCLIFYGIHYIFRRFKKTKYSLIVLAGAFMLCTPYLYYTYSLTGKKMYWGTQGGEILYWRSSPYPNEHGDWISSDVVLGNRTVHEYYDTSQLAKNHKSFIKSLESYSYVERDQRFKQKAIEQIKQNPGKYIQNTFASGLRLFFNYPFSHTPQKISTYFYIIPNSLLLIFLLSSVYIGIRKARIVPFEVRFVTLISLLYLGGLVLLNGKVRYLLPMIPMLLFLIFFMFGHFVKLNIDQKSTLENS